MSKVNAHIKNVNYESVEIVVRNDFTGAIMATKVFNEKPSQKSLDKAIDWIRGQYSIQNLNVTFEGFERPLSERLVNDEGVIIDREFVISDEIQSLEEFINSETSIDPNNIQASTRETVAGAVEQYVNSLKSRNISMPATSEEEADRSFNRLPPAGSIPANKLIKTDSDDEETDTGYSTFFHPRQNQFSDLELGESAGIEVSDSYTPEHDRYLKGLKNSGGISSTEKVDVFNNFKIPKTKKSAIDQSGDNPRKDTSKQSFVGKKENLERKGVGGDVLDEPVPDFNRAKYDHIIQNKNNASITLTRDRNTNLMSGYGGRGNTGAAAIDIVAGRMGNDPRKVDKENKAIKINPYFVPTNTNLGTFVDSARIYISQKADIDDYFKIVEGRVGQSVERSAICLKSDAVRIIGNEGIKLVTKTDSINSKGGRVKKNRGVDIIANNDDSKLQPMVLGDNMQKCVAEMAEMINNLIGALQATINNVAQLDVALASHIHISPFFGAPTLPSPNGMPMCIASLVELVSVESFSSAAQKWNVNTFKWKYLKHGSPLTIRSKFNNVN